jgi:hypothetical protein
MMDNSPQRAKAYAWEALYEHAISVADPEVRRQRLLEAQEAILHRAKILDDEPGDHEAEAQALEEAADFVRDMKLQTQSDGVAKEVNVGDSVPRSRKLSRNSVSTNQQD